MKILSLLSLPIILSMQPTPYIYVKNQNAEKLLILKGGTTNLTGKIGIAGCDEQPWVAYYAGKPMNVIWKIIDCSDERVKINSDGQVYWDAISSIQDITFKVAAEATIGRDHYYGQTRDQIILRIRPREWEQIYQYQFPEAQGSMFSFVEYGAFESKYTYTSSQLIEDVDFNFNDFKFYINLNGIHPRLGSGEISWPEGIGNLSINKEVQFNEPETEYHFSDYIEGQKALTKNSVSLDLLLKRSNNNIIITYTLNGHYYSPNVFEPRTHWCSWDEGALIDVYQYK